MNEDANYVTCSAASIKVLRKKIALPLEVFTTFYALIDGSSTLHDQVRLKPQTNDKEITMCFAKDIPEAKQHLKRSIAKMMVYWVVQSRHTLRDELLNNNPNNRWAGLDFKNAFASSPDEADKEFKKFFSKARDLFKEKKNHKGFIFLKVPESLLDPPLMEKLLIDGAELVEVVTAGAERINARVDGLDGGDADWCDLLDPNCPSNDIINAMFKAAMAFVDNTDWEAMPAVAQAFERQAAAQEKAAK